MIGTSPSAARRLIDVPPEATTIACNGAIDLFADRRLDYYLCFDEQACRRYTERAYRKQTTGTKLVTLGRKAGPLEDRNLTGFDIFLELSTPKPPLFIRGKFTQQLALSGLYCLAFAVNCGAKRVLLLGMEGYANFQAGKVTRVIRPVTQAICAACPDVEFVFYGKPRYRIEADNLQLTEGLDPCVS